MENWQKVRELRNIRVQAGLAKLAEISEREFAGRERNENLPVLTRIEAQEDFEAASREFAETPSATNFVWLQKAAIDLQEAAERDRDERAARRHARIDRNETWLIQESFYSGKTLISRPLPDLYTEERARSRAAMLQSGNIRRKFEARAATAEEFAEFGSMNR